MHKLDPKLLDKLACPLCRKRLALDAAADELRCADCGRAYPVRDGVPDLLPDSAAPQIERQRK